jgi:predicted RNA methylase
MIGGRSVAHVTFGGRAICKMPCFCVVSTTEHDRDLARAELWALSGVNSFARVVTVPRAVDVEHAAYVTVCAEELAAGPSLSALSEALAQRRPHFERFHITLVTLPPRPQVGSHAAIVEAARFVTGTVDAEHPLIELLLVGQEGEWRLGQIVSRASKTYFAHEQKPHGFSSALPARVARAMVNLGAKPGDTVIDPCCGVGTILLEAWAAGARAVGGELNRKLAGLTQANLRHFGRPPWVCIADACRPWARADVVVTDFPYGRQCARDPQLYERLLAALPGFAPRLVVVTAEDLGERLEQAGYEVLQAADVVKSHGFRRRVTLAQVR